MLINVIQSFLYIFNLTSFYNLLIVTDKMTLMTTNFVSSLFSNQFVSFYHCSVTVLPSYDGYPSALWHKLNISYLPLLQHTTYNIQAMMTVCTIWGKIIRTATGDKYRYKPFTAIMLIKGTTLVVLGPSRKTSVQKLAALTGNPEAPMKRNRIGLTSQNQEAPVATYNPRKLWERGGDRSGNFRGSWKGKQWEGWDCMWAKTKPEVTPNKLQAKTAPSWSNFCPSWEEKSHFSQTLLSTWTDDARKLLLLIIQSKIPKQVTFHVHLMKY